MNISQTGDGAPSPRRGSAETTRSALLTAALLRFGKHGYDQVSVRDIAQDAGVDAALVYRYFGSKEALFKEVSEFGSHLEQLLEIPLPAVPDHIIDFIVREPTEHGWAHPIAVLLRSSGREEPCERLRERLTETFTMTLAKRLPGPDAELRAELLAAWMCGISLMRSVIGTPTLKSVSEEVLRRSFRAGAAALLGPEDGAQAASAQE